MNTYSEDSRKKIVEAAKTFGVGIFSGSARDASGFFRHRGYRTAVQPL